LAKAINATSNAATAIMTQALKNNMLETEQLQRLIREAALNNDCG
jgi:hypothetical protein